MLRIRLARTGRKKLAHYRVVVSESDRTPTGGAATQIGYFDPHTEELNVDTQALQHYLDRGAQPSGRIVRLLQNRDDVTVPEQAKQNLVVKEEQATETEEEHAADETTGDESNDQTEAATSASEETSEQDSEDQPKTDTAETEQQTDDKEETDDAAEEKTQKAS